MKKKMKNIIERIKIWDKKASDSILKSDFGLEEIGIFVAIFMGIAVMVNRYILVRPLKRITKRIEATTETTLKVTNKIQLFLLFVLNIMFNTYVLLYAVELLNKALHVKTQVGVQGATNYALIMMVMGYIFSQLITLLVYLGVIGKNIQIAKDIKDEDDKVKQEKIEVINE